MKKLIIWSVISAIILAVCPVMCFKLMDDGRLLFVLLVFVQFAYPLLSLISGIVSGLSIEKLFLLPFITSGLFMLSICLIYGEPDYLVYTGINLAISLVVMCIVAFVKRRDKQTKSFANDAEL
ncbi:MAG: DUF2651 family protein [Ruminococcus sp.]|nr:DUF2651 family protein [Ruminococcus sp.]